MKQLLFTQKGIDLDGLYPFSLTRKVQDFLIGMMTIRKKWELSLRCDSFDVLDEDGLPSHSTSISLAHLQDGIKYYLIRGNVLPNQKLVATVKKMIPGESLTDVYGKTLVTCLTTIQHKIKKTKEVSHVKTISHAWHLFQYNEEACTFDFNLLTKAKKSALIDKSNYVSDTLKVFVEKGARLKHAVINCDNGPVYISKNAKVMEGALLQGPLFVGEGAVIKMGAKIYGATTIGKKCIVGGEVKNAVLFDFSNKGHDGYLGDSVIGSWCNLGAGTSNSNLKNTAGNIDVNLPNGVWRVGQKCGVLMGDYSKTAINTSINTGTVIGVNANVFGNELTPSLIPSFTWGMNNKKKYKLNKALLDADNWMQMKGELLTDEQKMILTHIYKQTK